MNRTLSVLLPVVNAQSTLGPLMGQLLEMLPELTSKFEILVIDQGSSDDTADVIRELATAYPQVSGMALPWHENLMTVLRRGLAQSAGDYVLLREPNCRADLGGLHNIWNLGRTHDMVVGLAQSLEMRGPVSPLGDRPPATSRLRLVQRRVCWAWLSAGTEEPLDAYLVRKRYRTCEVPIRLARNNSAERPLEPRTRRPANAPLVTPARLDPGSAGPATPSSVKRPSYLSYLSRFKTFALGE